MGTNPLSNLWATGRPLLLVGLLLFLSFTTNEAVIAYRMEEFNRAMESLSQKYNQSHSLGMLARFELIRRRKDMPEEDEAALELRMRALSSGRPADTARVSRRGWKDYAIGGAIAFTRFLLGKRAPIPEATPRARGDLEVGYVYERARKYDKAVGAYSGALESGAGDRAPAALLHRGFCLSLLSEYPRAEEDFRRVLDLVPGGEESRTAERFLEILKGLQEELRLAKAARQGPLAYARKLLALSNYTGALEELGQALSRPGMSRVDRQEGLYLYGRAQEEVGFDSGAVTTYRSLIRDAPESPFARKANRRLYVLGKVYVNDQDLEQEALKKIEQYQDLKFVERLKGFAAMRLPESRAANRAGGLGELAKAASAISTDGLENISAAALGTASPEPQKAREDEARLETRKPSARKAESTRRANARRVADPLRREAILQVLASNKGELEFLYQKWLRKGAAFEGELTVRLRIAPTGDVREARVVAEKSGISHSGFIADVLKSLRRWKFRDDPGTREDLPVTFPLRFVNKE